MAVNLSSIRDLLLPGLRGIEGKYEIALYLIVFAAFLDGIDGRIARLLKASQPQLKVLKPELDTAPRVFYIGLDERFSGKVEGGGTLWKPRNLQSSAHG